jgi:hypothetical protein
MDVDYPPGEEPATPEYVLSVFQDWHRQACALDEGDPSVTLGFDTTIHAWRDAYDLVGWRQLAEGLNGAFKIDCPIADWKRALVPPRKKTLRNVCELIARFACRPWVRAAPVLGCRGLSAGAFLTIRSLLHQAGANVDEIRPSSPLSPYTRRYASVFLGQIAMLAPGILPSVRVRRSSIQVTTMWGCGVAVVLMVVGMIGGAPLLTAVSIVLVLSFYLFMWTSAIWDKPDSVEFGELRTFRDLAKVIAAAGGR